MTNFRNSAATLPGIDLSKTFAAFPVWKGSTQARVKFTPLADSAALSRKRATKLYFAAEEFEGQTRKPGQQDGAIGRNGLATLRALLFYFLSHKTGQLDPCYESIARKANISVRSVARGLVKLKAAGVLNWVRRYANAAQETGGWILEQISNAYAVLPTGQWRGFKAPPEPPRPDPDSVGAHPRPPHEYVQAAEDLRAGLSTGSPLAPLAGAVDALAKMRAKHKPPL